MKAHILVLVMFLMLAVPALAGPDMGEAKEVADTVIAKVEAIVAKAAPHAAEFTGDAVGYLLVKKCLSLGIPISLFAIFLIAGRRLLRKGQEWEAERLAGGRRGFGGDRNASSEGEDVINTLGVILQILAGVSLVVALCLLPGIIAAIAYPNIYAVECLLHWL